MLIESDGVALVMTQDCQPDLTRCDVAVFTGSFTVIACDVTVLLAFPIPRFKVPPFGAFLLWDANGNGRPNGVAILIDRDGDGDFGESREIRVFGDSGCL